MFRNAVISSRACTKRNREPKRPAAHAPCSRAVARAAALAVLFVVAGTAGCQSRVETELPTGSDASAPAVDEGPGVSSATARALARAWALLEGGDVPSARAVVEALRVGSADDTEASLDREERLELQLLDAGLALASGDFGQADAGLRRLDGVQVRRHLRFATLQAEIDAAYGDYAGAVARLIAFDATASGEVEALGRAIWRHGVRARGYRVAERRGRAATDDERAWWRFLETYNDALTPVRQRALWMGWRRSHPHHPGARVAPSGWEGSPPARIALLLPLSGRLAGAGEAVRDGFLAAYFGAGPVPSQSVQLYDTGAATVDALYEEALASGAKAIVGPLSKDNVARMWTLDPVVPTLTLNSVAAPATAGEPARVVQFALAVEDEGRALARRVTGDGRGRVLVFRLGTDWSERAAGAFETGLGEGSVLVDEAVFRDIKEVTAVVGSRCRWTKARGAARRWRVSLPGKRSSSRRADGRTWTASWRSSTATTWLPWWRRSSSTSPRTSRCTPLLRRAAT